MPQPVPTLVISILFSVTAISFWLWMFVEKIRNDRKGLEPAASRGLQPLW